MKEQSLYFKDNFFSAGRTDIFNSSKEKVGELDLKSAFSSSIDVLDQGGNQVVCGKFLFFSNKWRIFDKSEQEIGVLKEKWTFFSKKYEYNAFERGIYLIESEAFSRQYEVFDDQSHQIARFEKVSGFFSSSAYQLTNLSEQLTAEELIAVVMGVNAIQKRKSAAANSGGGGN